MARLVSRTPNGVLVGDQRKDQILLLQDMDGNGTTSGAGETRVFFDGENASGLMTPTGNVFTIHQAADKSVYFGDGNTDSVYRLIDTNGDGDAQDAGEAQVWFSGDNAEGFSTVTPNGVHEGPDGAIYIANAGVSSAPQDAIYRTVDLNGDGDANDAGEATLWLDLQTVIDTAVPFDLSFDGEVAYLNDLTGAAVDVIHRIEDKNGDGSIQTDEVTPFISGDMNFGAPVDIASAVAVDGSLYTLTWFPEAGEALKVCRLNDLDGSGQIDAAGEATEIWNANQMPNGIAAEIGFSITADEDGNLTLVGNNFAGEGNVIRLSDATGDGDYFDGGETALFGSSTFDDQLTRPRALETYEGKAQVVAGTVGAGNHFSVFLDQDNNTLYTSGENVVGQLGNGATGFDIKTPLAVAMPEGFDGKIVSVSAGLLHTTFLTEDGDVYAFGFNNRGPLGTGDEDTRTSAVKIGALHDVSAAIIENGNGVSYAISDIGQLFGWGNNSNGQLGLGDQDERLTPQLVEALENETVVTVSSGNAHTLALTADGQVWAFGSNTDGQLGSTDALEEDGTPARRALEPVLVEGLPENIISVTADTKTSFAVTDEGRVFGWGESRNGQLLQGDDNGDGTFTPDTADVLVPVELTGLPGNVVEVKGGARWAMALTEDGDVYAWGPNDEGPTGGLDGDPAVESDASFYPTLIAELDDVNIVELQSGPNSLIAVSNTGEIFTWGSNSDGRPGFASEGSVYAPAQVELGGEADPFLVSATPGDNARDVGNDSVLTLTFTEEVTEGDGAITLVNREDGTRTEIDVRDTRLVQVDGDTVHVTPPEHLEAVARHAVEIADGAFVDLDGNSYAGIAEGDTSSINFTTDETLSLAKAGQGSRGDDLLRAGAGDDRINARTGDDIVSGGAGNDRIKGGFGDDLLIGGANNDQIAGGVGSDTLFGGHGNDRLKGDRGNDALSGGDGNDLLVGGLGDDSFHFNSGNDVIRDFETGFDTRGTGFSGDAIVLDIEGIDTFADVLDRASQVGRNTVLDFGEEDSLVLKNVWLWELDSGDFTFL